MAVSLSAVSVCMCGYTSYAFMLAVYSEQAAWEYCRFGACLPRWNNFWVTMMRVCYRVSCDPVLTKLLVKLSVC